MAPLSDDDIEKLFSGAPQYFDRSEGHFTGAPHPSVAYPWDESLGIRDLTDHVQIEDEAWTGVTAWPHITRRRAATTAVDAAAAESANDTGNDSDAPPRPVKKRSHFYPRCRERPSMLSIQGLEKGTIGYEAALELAVSDALQNEQYGFDSLGVRPVAVTEARRKLMGPGKPVAAARAASPTKAAAAGDAAADDANGVKYVGETQILEELIKNGRRYADGSFYDPHQSKQFYDELFHHILRGPNNRTHTPHKRSGMHAGGPGSDLYFDLIPQIEALLDVLATPNVWIDFSHVEWRLRLGQILWASSAQDVFHAGVGATWDEASSAAAGSRQATVDERYTERYWLLLQILLSTELLLRLDAITEGDEYGLEYVRPSEIHRFEKVASASVRWSLILARAWLENIEVVRMDEVVEDDKAGKSDKNDKNDKNDKAEAHQRHSSVSSSSTTRSKREMRLRHTVGWITTLTKKLTMGEGYGLAAKAPEKKHIYSMRARHASRQYRGVAHFAEALKWPNDLSELVKQRALDTAHVREPLNTKIPDTPSPADAAQGLPIVKPKLEFSRHLPRRRKVVAGLHHSGWLSRSYLSGLMLPGDGLCNLLMATLLEGDEEALKMLGSVAYLGAGFVYGTKSFWITACVVGRVLAAGAGAAECMGWVSSDVVPAHLGQGWYNIGADDVAEDMRLTESRARIWGKAAIERESSVLGDAEPNAIMPADFVIPFEAVYKEQPPKHTGVELRQLELFAPQDPNRPPRKAGDGTIHPAAPVDAAKEPPQLVEPFESQLSFAVACSGRDEKIYTFSLRYDIYFVTAHTCMAPQRVKVVKAASSPTIQQIDVSGSSPTGRSSTVHTTGMFRSHPPILPMARMPADFLS